MLAEMYKDLYDVLTAFSKAKSISDSAVAYLTTMAIRIYYMHEPKKYGHKYTFRSLSY